MRIVHFCARSLSAGRLSISWFRSLGWKLDELLAVTCSVADLGWWPLLVGGRGFFPGFGLDLAGS